MRESSRERDLRNQCIGFERGLRVLEEEWRRREPACNMQKRSDPTADLLWSLIERARESNAKTDGEWRKLMRRRQQLEEKARKAKRSRVGRAM